MSPAMRDSVPANPVSGEQSGAGARCPATASVSGMPAEALSTTVARAKGAPRLLGARLITKVAVFPLTARHKTEVLTNVSPLKTMVAEPVGFSPEGPLVMLTAPFEYVGVVIPLP